MLHYLLGIVYYKTYTYAYIIYTGMAHSQVPAPSKNSHSPVCKQQWASLNIPQVFCFLLHGAGVQTVSVVLRPVH